MDRRRVRFAMLPKLLGMVLSAVVMTTACSPGLGTQVDMKGPVLQLSSPEYMQNVNRNFTVEGTVQDDQGILEVVITTSVSTASWRLFSGAWQYRASSGALWVPYVNGTVTQAGAMRYEWSVDIDLGTDDDGEYVVTVISRDAAQNSDANSFQERTVVVDNNPPVVTLSNPVMLPGFLASNLAELNGYALRSIQDLRKLYNGSVPVRWNIDEPIEIESLQIEIADDAGTVFATETLTRSANTLSLNGSIQIPASNLRNPDNTPLAVKTPLQVITRAVDAAGNTEENKSHGWFLWWPEADKPWIATDLSTSTASPTSIVPGYDISGQAYDDDGVDRVRISLYEGFGTAVLLDTEEIADAEGKGSFNWKYTPPSTAGEYTVVLEAIDTNTLSSDTVTGYFKLEDINTPGIVITAPSRSDTLFGNAAGDFTIEGLAHDDTNIAEVRLVWINPEGADPAESRLEYTNPEFPDWNATGADTDGNKRWNISLGSGYPWPEDIRRTARDFSHTLNLFSDCNVQLGVRSLRNFTFLLRTQDVNGKYRVEVFTTSGDRSIPDLSIDSITVRKANNTSVTRQFPIHTPLPRFESGDTVRFNGLWSDDSQAAWDTVSRYQFALLWGSTPLTVLPDMNGSWTSVYTVPPEGTVATIQAELLDIGGNRVTRSRSFLIETDEAALVRITSPLNDGTYAAGDVIPIQLDFNKTVSFTGGTPSLRLTGGYTATYVSGSGSASHVYTWTVPVGANVADLDVTALLANGCSFEVVDTGIELVPVLPAGSFSLAGGKNIAIDTTAPAISSVITSASAGSYGAGKEVFFTITFSEPVVLSGLTPGPSIQLNHDGAEAVYHAQTNSRTMIFVYTTEAGHNTGAVGVGTMLTLNGSTIQDAAGNSLETAIPAPSLPVIRIDTTPPATPVITGVTDSVTYYAAPQVVVSGLEGGSNHEYSVDGGSTWIAYPAGGFTLSQNGTYTIVVRQTDAAGNCTESAPVSNATVDIGNLVRRISAVETDGVYTSGTIDITVFLRKPLTVHGSPRLTLNTGVPGTADYVSGSGTETLRFRYTIVDDADVTRLDVTAIDWNGGEFRDSGGLAVNDECTLPLAGSGNRLTEQKNIRIVTGVPEVLAVTGTGSALNIQFDRPIRKGTGSIRVVQDASGYRVPIVIDEDSWLEIWNKASTAEQTILGENYTLGTNGANSEGVSDTGAKYILSFDRDPDYAALVAVFRGANIEEHVSGIPVVSSMVTIPVLPGNMITIQLTGSYALPTRGATYTVEIPEGLVTDSYSNVNPVPSAVYTITPEGIEPPVIRIEKNSESYVVDGTVVRAVQPLTASVKINCRTPGAEIRYTITGSWFDTDQIDPLLQQAPDGAKPAPSAAPAAPAIPVGTSMLYEGEFSIGDSSDIVRGLKYRIRARSRTGTTWSDDAWETAYRSVLIMNNSTGVDLDRDEDDGYSNSLVEQPWVRGGDALSGTALTPGFPLSWDSWDFDGIRLMTRDPDNATIWYWVSWDIGTTAYVGLVLGSTPTDPAEAEELGPAIWGWGKNSWVPFKEYYPLFPGESRTLRLGDFEAFLNRGPFEFATTTEGGTTSR